MLVTCRTANDDRSMRTALRHAALAAALLVSGVGCAGDENEQLPSNPPGSSAPDEESEKEVSDDPCGERVAVPVAADHPFDGTSPAAIAAEMQGTHDVSLLWRGAPPVGSVMLSEHATQAHVEVRPDATMARVVERQGCSAVLEMTSTLTVRTDDGTFREVIPATLRGSATDAFVFTSRISPDALVGSYDASFFEPEAPTISFVLNLSKERGGSAVSVDGHAFMCGSEPGSVCAFIVDIS
jgi:hypothetical protein